MDDEEAGPGAWGDNGEMGGEDGLEDGGDMRGGGKGEVDSCLCDREWGRMISRAVLVW